jgi:hypothetical protein
MRLNVAKPDPALNYMARNLHTAEDLRLSKVGGEGWILCDWPKLR